MVDLFGAYPDPHTDHYAFREVDSNLCGCRDCSFILPKILSKVEAEIDCYWKLPIIFPIRTSKKDELGIIGCGYMLKRKARLVAHEKRMRRPAFAGYRYGNRLFCRHDETWRLAGGSYWKECPCARICQRAFRLEVKPDWRADSTISQSVVLRRPRIPGHMEAKGRFDLRSARHGERTGGAVCFACFCGRLAGGYCQRVRASFSVIAHFW